MSHVGAIMKLIMEEVAPNVRSLYGARWPALMNIHPEKGGFIDADQFGSLMTEVRNVFGVLKSNLSKSGTQESGENLDGTALEFCKYKCSPIRYNIPYEPVTPNRWFLSRVHDIHEKSFPAFF
jgi:hypothetical protein